MRVADEYTLRIVLTAADLARSAADVVSETVRDKPDAVLALPTGSTPLGMFTELARRARAGTTDFSRTRFFCLDEYLGLSMEDPNSLTGWLFREFFTPAGIDAAQVHTVPSEPADAEADAQAYEDAISRAGGLDLAVLGIGPNGHIAFNEPGSTRDSRTRVLDLTPESRDQAAAYWQGTFPAPSRAMTIGVGTLLEAAKIVLIASGEAKAGILHAALRGPISPAVPASLLRPNPEKLIVIADAAAAREL
ncbi:MAG: glucosamine-6-phosphate deaminase [Chloroflexota bacterium]|nr:glucosamine-6-phosphate deaminase [Chloroflexota bacterium]